MPLARSVLLRRVLLLRLLETRESRGLSGSGGGGDRLDPLHRLVALGRGGARGRPTAGAGGGSGGGLGRLVLLGLGESSPAGLDLVLEVHAEGAADRRDGVETKTVMRV